MTYRSPTTGRVLNPDTPHSLAAEGERWPVVEDIPYLRGGSEDLATEVLSRLDAGLQEEALALLLSENDPWWDETPPPFDDLLAAVREAEALSLREVMERLGWGRVGTYFAHRWSDPTFLAGLTLLDRHWGEPDSAFELACGIGHYLAALRDVGVRQLAGADIVFGKLWVAKRWVCPEADYVCFDADADWPIQPAADVVLCTDAFYFLRDKDAVAERLRGAARSSYAVAHVHNAGHDNYSAGAAARHDELRALFPDAILYDDEALTRAGAGGSPLATGVSQDAEAFSLIGGPGLVETPGGGGLVDPCPGTVLTRNPLLDDAGTVTWPSERYASEYGARATYGRSGPVPERAAITPQLAPLARRRDLLALPPRW